MTRRPGATGYLTEVGKDEYKGNDLTKALSNPAIAHGYLALNADLSVSLLRMLTGAGTEKAGQTDARGTPVMHASWTDNLGGYSLDRLPWMDSSIYPVQGRLIYGANADASSPLTLSGGYWREHWSGPASI
ncbi:hypothetical protein J3459_016602 [Metarhizium acridum]|nr:hypothetical protein J3459_016602 [Metarhizium acridum]